MNRPKLAICLSLILIIAAFCYGFWVYSQRVQRQWDEMLHKVELLMTSINERPGKRPVLWGASVGGRAFEEYDKAFSILTPLLDSDTWSEIFEMLIDWDRDAKEPNPKALEGWLVRLQPLFNAIRRGAHREDGRRSHSWDDELMLDKYHLTELAQVTLWSCRDLRRNGDDVEAVRRALDLMQLCNDLLHDPFMIFSLMGAGSMIWVLDGLFLEVADMHDREYELKAHVTRPEQILPLDGLDSAALALLHEGLARLDRPVPSLDTVFSAETAGLCKSGINLLLAEENAEHIADCSLAGRDAITNTVMSVLSILEGLGKTGTTWSSVDRMLNNLEPKIEPLASDSRRFAVQGLSKFRRFAITRRRTVTNIRLLRMALHEVTGSSKRVDDPFGAALLFAKFKDRTKYWSVGENGVNDGGDPKKDVVLIR